MRIKIISAAIAGAMFLTACGGDDDAADDASETPSTTESTEEAMDEAETLEVTAVDYSFQGLTAEIAAGTQIQFTNASEAEVHEIVALNYGDDERPLADILVELGAALESGEGVAEIEARVRYIEIEGPGGQPEIPAAGDGTLTEPGRYIFLCAIQQGADPEAYFAEAARMQEAGEAGPVMLEDAGMPHAQLGMVAEAQVS